MKSYRDVKLAVSFLAAGAIALMAIAQLMCNYAVQGTGQCGTPLPTNPPLLCCFTYGPCTYGSNCVSGQVFLMCLQSNITPMCVQTLMTPLMVYDGEPVPCCINGGQQPWQCSGTCPWVYATLSCN